MEQGEIKQAYDAGREAFVKVINPNTNPFPYRPGTSARHRAWLNGYHFEAQTQRRPEGEEKK